MSVQRIRILGVPVDVCQKTELEEKILELMEKDGPSQIIFLNIWDLLKARGKNEFGECVRNADLVLPVSKSILKGAKFLKKTVPVRYNPFDATISILGLLENRYKSFYMFGGRKKALVEAEKNVKKTFKTLRVVGRYVGYYKAGAEDGIIEAIRKSSPSLVLLSEGVKNRELWPYQNREKFTTSIFMYYRDAVGIFGRRIKRVNPSTFEKGHEIYGEVLRNPLKLFLLFPYSWYIICLVWHRLFKRED
ncbi:MAG: WecB/TagA/CpsF family glycosyltransferase [Treponema sp.]|nr:WecB/TagA/CpsF family glycosyltransferase [Candidatus Treponema equi]